MAKKKAQNIIETRDLSLVAYLQLKWFKWQDAQSVDWKVTFVFEKTDNIEKEIQNYFNDEWNFLSFASRLKDLKTFIHQFG